MANIKATPTTICSVFVSLFLLIIGGSLGCLGPFFLKYIIDSKMILTPTSSVYNLWKEFPFAIPMDFYFFNWTNPEDVYKKNVKPKFEEVGPYRFMENKMKSDVKWNDNNGTVSYKQLKFWYYSDDENNGNLQDKITTVNPVALLLDYKYKLSTKKVYKTKDHDLRIVKTDTDETYRLNIDYALWEATVHVSRNWNFLVRQGLSLTLSRLAPTINITRTVSQMLFEGYPDTLIKIANTMPFFVDQELPPWDKFGWFYMRNGSADFEGVFNMGTGKNTTFGKLYQWNYWSNTPFYKSECSKVDGSAGEIFQPSKNSETIKVFSSDLCQTLVLKYVGKTKVDNIIGNKYVVEDYMLDNGTIYEGNKCLCNGECVPSGVVNVSSCRYGSPSFGSLPHFYNADKYYLNLLEGLQPDKNKHEFSIILEPTTGIPLEVNARLQINLLLQAVPGISMYENAPKVFFPMLWFEQKVKIPKEEAYRIRLLLNIPAICILLGILLSLFGLTLLSYNMYSNFRSYRLEKRNKNVPLNTEDFVPMLKK